MSNEEKLIPSKIRMDQMQMIDIYLEESKNDVSLINFLEKIKDKIELGLITLKEVKE